MYIPRDLSRKWLTFTIILRMYDRQMQGDSPETAMEIQKLMLRHVCLWRNKLEREVDTVDHWNMHQGGAQPIRQDSHLAARQKRGVSIGSRFTGAVSQYLGGVEESPSPTFRYQTSPKRGPPSPVARVASLWDAEMLEHHDGGALSHVEGKKVNKNGSFLSVRSAKSQRGEMRGSSRSPRESSPINSESCCFWSPFTCARHHFALKTP